MMFEEVEAKFNSVWKQMEDFIPIGSKEEAERIKRKGLNLEQESANAILMAVASLLLLAVGTFFTGSRNFICQWELYNWQWECLVTEEAKSSNEVPEEKVKEMMQLVPIEEVYIEALQVKHLIIDWKVQTEGQRSY
nr:hypothetical protein [Tanacetum cinerariifolium]